jgi:hypothetical protein
MRPLGGAGAGDTGASTINTKKHRQRAPEEVPELYIRERPPSTLTNVDGGPLGRVRDLGAPTINVTNVDGGTRRWAPWEVQEVEIWEC